MRAKTQFALGHFPALGACLQISEFESAAMKRSLVLPIGVTVAITLFSSVGLHKAEEVAAKNAAVVPAASLRWYYVDQDDGVDLAGQSKLEPQQIADSLKENISGLKTSGLWMRLASGLRARARI